MSGVYCCSHGSQSRVSAARADGLLELSNAAVSSSRSNTCHSSKLEHVLSRLVERPTVRRSSNCRGPTVRYGNRLSGSPLRRHAARVAQRLGRPLGARVLRGRLHRRGHHELRRGRQSRSPRRRPPLRAGQRGAGRRPLVARLLLSRRHRGRLRRRSRGGRRLRRATGDANVAGVNIEDSSNESADPACRTRREGRRRQEPLPRCLRQRAGRHLLARPGRRSRGRRSSAPSAMSMPAPTVSSFPGVGDEDTDSAQLCAHIDRPVNVLASPDVVGRTARGRAGCGECRRARCPTGRRCTRRSKRRLPCATVAGFPPPLPYGQMQVQAARLPSAVMSARG